MSELEGVIAAVRRRALDKATRNDMTRTHAPIIGQPLSESELSSIERKLGLVLPELVRRIYAEIGDGGFGPGYGFLPMLKPQSEIDDSVVGLYTVFSESDPSDPTWKWPEALLPVVDFGCAIRACVDCDTGEVIVSDPNRHESDWSATFLDQGCTLQEWLRYWCAGQNLWERIHARRVT